MRNNTLLFFIIASMTALFVPEAFAGSSALLDGLATETTSAVFGPGVKIVVGVGAIGGAIIAGFSGKPMLAGIGVLIGVFMFASQTLMNSSVFSAII
jgi:hypothetical protein